MDQWIFQDLSECYGPLATNLWTSMFCMFELKTIMRQKDDKTYAELLNRLREAKHTSDDIAVLKTRLITEINTYPANSVCLYTTNKKVDHHNAEVYNASGNPKCIIPSIDTVIGDVSKEVKLCVKAKIPSVTSKTMGLLTNLPVAVGLHYELCLNVAVEDGLTNGTSCVVKKFDFRVAGHQRCSIVWCQFPRDVGEEWRKRHKNLYTTGISLSWTPVLEVQRQFPVGRFKDCQIMRRQYPLRPATAKTIHKSQGDTLPSLVVDLGVRKIPHSHYVALSRVVSINSLYVHELNEQKICVSDGVKCEMDRLRTEAALKTTDTLLEMSSVQTVIGFQNVRSLHKHIKSLESFYLTQQFSIFGVAETKLRSSDATQDYAIENFQLMRKDYPMAQHQTCRPPYGIAVYHKLPCQLIATYSQLQTEFIVLSFPMLQIQIAFLYISPKVSTLSAVTAIVRNVLGHFSMQTSMIVGDFNLHTKRLEQFMRQHGYHQLITQPTTDYGSVLDQAYINRLARVHSSGVLESYFSDHKPIFVVLNAC